MATGSKDAETNDPITFEEKIEHDEEFEWGSEDDEWWRTDETWV